MTTKKPDDVQDEGSGTTLGITRRTWLKLTAGMSAAAFSGQLWEARADMALPAKRAVSAHATFQNPLFAGDYPDPTILRVGHDFYMTHTSYSYAPGLVVWHSRDLVNWTPISQVVNNTHGEIWAPDLAYHNGLYYIYFPMGGIYVVTAKDPSGPWSEPVSLGINDIDPGHVVGPDGTRFLYTAGGHAVELSADGLSVVGEPKKIYDGWKFPEGWKTEGYWLESPKLTRRGDFYYLICAEGGTAGPPTSHMSVVARSTSIVGPWENSPHNPLIHTYSADEDWWSVGHGTLVTTPDDRWYFVYHGYRKEFQTLGRNTLLEPIEWTSDGWPVAMLGARRGEIMPAPMGIRQRPMLELSDDFTTTSLKATWAAWKEDDMTRYKVGGGKLVVKGKGTGYADSSPLTIRARDKSYTVQVSANVEETGCASLAIEYYPTVAVVVQLSNGLISTIVPNQSLSPVSWSQKSVWLKIVNNRNLVELFVSSDGIRWESIVSNIDISDFDQNGQHGGFQAARPAIAASGTGTVEFRDFRYTGL